VPKQITFNVKHYKKIFLLAIKVVVMQKNNNKKKSKRQNGTLKRIVYSKAHQV
jgi:hypothetical protein